MKKMRKCLNCKIYTFKNNCPKCNNETILAHPMFKFAKYSKYRKLIENGS